jgi:S-DNA-T family DNA segregation ATPase FtsK/SpoIIIE
VALCALGLLLGLGLVSPGATGWFGRFLEMGIRLLVGQAVLLTPFALVAAGVALAADYHRTTRPATLFGLAGLFIVVVGGLHLWAWGDGESYHSTAARFGAMLGATDRLALARQPDGGLCGALVTSLLSPLAVVGSWVTLVAVALGSLLVLTNVTLAAAAERVRERSQHAAAAAVEPWRARRERRQREREAVFLDLGDTRPPTAEPAAAPPARRSKPLAELLARTAGAKEDLVAEAPLAAESAMALPVRAAPEVTLAPPFLEERSPAPAEKRDPPREEPREEKRRPPVVANAPRAARRAPQPAGTGEYRMPPLDLLDAPKSRPKKIPADTEANIAILENTLAQFKIQAQVVEIADGPTVTRYEIRLGEGIRVKKILDLADNLAMSLAAWSVRVEAPIPGKSAIGIEVPKKQPATVTLRECLETEEFAQHPSRIAFALGKDVAGQAQYADLARMPHLLVAGATNSGKSVCLNVLIASLLYRAHPDDLKLIMIDPKRVELTLFEGIPHLIHPVVKDVKQAAGILRWALKEMERRYDLFAKVMTRNLEGYNAKVGDHPDARLPFIVVIIDELADLMMLQGPEVEQSICRLAQLARATGIHLVIATQRPSVDVITGLIKANVPSRIAFAVTSHIDSRTILDCKGGEQLIGRGDMLFKPVDANKPLRVQGAFLSESEVNRVVEHLKQQGPPAYLAEPLAVDSAAFGGRDSEEDAEDDLFEPAARFIVTTGHASTSMIQRKFKIGYTRAARLVDMMESRGIVGGLDGAKPREILVSATRLDEMFRSTREALFNPGGADDDLQAPTEDLEDGGEDPFAG